MSMHKHPTILPTPTLILCQMPHHLPTYPAHHVSSHPKDTERLSENNIISLPLFISCAAPSLNTVTVPKPECFVDERRSTCHNITTLELPKSCHCSMICLNSCLLLLVLIFAMVSSFVSAERVGVIFRNSSTSEIRSDLIIFTCRIRI